MKDSECINTKLKKTEEMKKNRRKYENERNKIVNRGREIEMLG